MSHKTLILFFVVGPMTACVPADRPLTPGERDAIAASVDSATRAFAAAEIALDAERTVAHLAPEFYMYNDGVRADYEAAASSVRASLPSFQTFRSDWTDLEVIVLGRNAAVASFLFDDSLVTGEGDVVRLRGPTTLVWERRGDDWLIVYADADHYPPVR